MDLPKQVMDEVYWSFTGTVSSDIAAFNHQVQQYQISIKDENTWRPEEVVIPCPKIRVLYMCWQDGDQVEPIIELTSDNGKSFSAGELLFKVHNAVVEKLREIDHHFFEGFCLSSRQSSHKAPLYILSQGS